MNKAVILAAGLGTRMRKAEESATLSAEQAQAAASGVKALIPVGESKRPFLDYAMTALVEAGYRKVCLVIGPDHHQIRDYYTKTAPPSVLSIDFAVQAKPLGTANACAAAEAFSAGEDFILVNSDNFYPPEALRKLRELSGPGLAAYEKNAMVNGSNIAADKISKFAAIEIDGHGCMRQIHEKPTDETLAKLGSPTYLSMNCWRFTAKVFDACRAIPLSPRNEYEITDAAQWCIDHFHERYAAVKVEAPVLDLSSRGDIGPVTQRLAGMTVRY
jgi:glucose-1-phosphate thymidylyltransferase